MNDSPFTAGETPISSKTSFRKDLEPLPPFHDGKVAPVESERRIDNLDLIRGVAVIGILWANIIGFGQPMLAGSYPEAFLTESEDPGGWLWISQFVLIDGKMRGLFTLLFGVGIALFVEKAWAKGSSRLLQAWRLVILMGFGLVHYFLIWPGDILIYYATFGLIALLCLKWDPQVQFRAGLAIYATGSLLLALLATTQWVMTDIQYGMSPTEKAAIEKEIDQIGAQDKIENDLLIRGDYTGLVTHRITEDWHVPFDNMIFLGFESLPLILIGMGLYRMGFFARRLDISRFVPWAAGGVLIGAILHFIIGLIVKSYEFSFSITFAAIAGWSMIPRLMMVLGITVIMVRISPSARGWFADRLRAAGRCAFTNYLGTSIVMMIIFQGWGLGLFGKLNRPELYMIALAVSLAILAWSRPWLRIFNYGPLEWLWRCLTYRQVFPLRKHRGQLQ